MANKNAKTDHLKKTQFQNLPADKKQAITSKGGKASQKAQKEKKEQEKEKQKLADIFEIILKSEVNEKSKIKIKKKFPELDLNNKSLIAVETMARMFETYKNKAKDTDGNEIEVIERAMNNKDFLSYQEFIRNTIGEKPVEKVFNFNSEFNFNDEDEELLNKFAKKHFSICRPHKLNNSKHA